MAIRPEEITEILKREIENYRPESEEVNFGTVIQVGDNIATIYGLSEARAGELLQFERTGIYAIVFNLEEDTIGCVVLGRDTEIKEGDVVIRTGNIVEVPVGEALIGRGRGPVGPSHRRQGGRQFHRKAPHREQGAGRGRPSAGGPAPADGPQGHRRHGAHRTGPA